MNRLYHLATGKESKELLDLCFEIEKHHSNLNRYHLGQNEVSTALIRFNEHLSNDGLCAEFRAFLEALVRDDVSMMQRLIKLMDTRRWSLFVERYKELIELLNKLIKTDNRFRAPRQEVINACKTVNKANKVMHKLFKMVEEENIPELKPL